VVRPAAAGTVAASGVGGVRATHVSDLFFLFVLHGSVQCTIQQGTAETGTAAAEEERRQQQHILHTGSSITIPAHTQFELSAWSADLEVLEIQVFR
jgi:hypothetical protein